MTADFTGRGGASNARNLDTKPTTVGASSLLQGGKSRRLLTEQGRQKITKMGSSRKTETQPVDYPNDAGTKTNGCLLETRSSAKHGCLVFADCTEVPYISYMENACSNRAFPIDVEMPVREEESEWQGCTDLE